MYESPCPSDDDPPSPRLPVQQRRKAWPTNANEIHRSLPPSNPALPLLPTSNTTTSSMLSHRYPPRLVAVSTVHDPAMFLSRPQRLGPVSRSAPRQRRTAGRSGDGVPQKRPRTIAGGVRCRDEQQRLVCQTNPRWSVHDPTARSGRGAGPGNDGGRRGTAGRTAQRGRSTAKPAEDQCWWCTLSPRATLEGAQLHERAIWDLARVGISPLARDIHSSFVGPSTLREESILDLRPNTLLIARGPLRTAFVL